MDFKKVRSHVDTTIILDMERASVKELKVYYDPSDETAMFVIVPEKYPKEEDLAAIINAKAQVKLQAKKNTSFGNK